MAKEKNFNPVQAAKKAEKQKQIKKQKANLQAQRNEKLARRNPARIQRDIDSLKQLSESGDIRPHERQRLSELEKDLAAVNKARSALGDNAPQFKERRGGHDNDHGRGGARGGRGGVLGKRNRDGSWRRRNADGEESSETDEDVKHIPMPQDTPPPIPRRHPRPSQQINPSQQTNEEIPPEPKKPTLVYEAAPQVRDLRKEAAQFVPAAVAQKMRQAKGTGGLIKEEDFDRLEKEGYIKSERADAGTDKGPGKVDAIVDKELEEFEESLRQDVGLVGEKAVGAAGEEACSGKMANEVHGAIAGVDSEGTIAARNRHHVEIEEVEDEDL